MVPLRELPDDERPRERLLAAGPTALSDAELLALVLGTGTPGHDALACGRAILRSCDGLDELEAASVIELTRLPGMGVARACRLKAALELGRRGCGERPRRGERIRSSRQLYEHVRARLAPLKHEVFLALPLDSKHRPIRELWIAEGTLASVDVHPREAFRELVRHAAAATFFIHNHPSGDPEPSSDDLALTARLRDVGALLGIPVLDHVVVGQEGYVSLADRGLL
ncbi:MAG TPA: DNA repair protein RadC [Polyangia bacterium]